MHSKCHFWFNSGPAQAKIEIWNWNCLSNIVEYRLISKKGEGTFSEVLKAQSTKTNKYVAIKCMKAHFYNIDQVSAPIACQNPDQ